ncbi:leucine-rich repeat protein [Butyrivibrio sp. INlla16]|uniref:leucine-rich repeat protein n=1 Tax=Butyrivibrio sp. INlla16 TaxID=1520807 RepID=UPI000882D6C3|nr:leucine-rich repeat protein [Butyrivibrio sp. INlla16]SDB01954.1 Leucine rich repeat-containing protein [Butyrivibrio sp. INlla16]
MKYIANKRTFSLTLAMIISISILPVFNKSLTVYAKTSNKTITGLGTGAIENPVKGGGEWNYVYYGQYENKSVKYRVLDTDCTDFSDYGKISKNTMLLDCDSVLYHLMPGTSAGLIEDLNDQGFLDADVFTDAEKDAIAFSRKERRSSSDGEGVDGGFAQLKETKIFVLDPKEVTNTSYGYKDQTEDLNRIKKNISTGRKDDWWLRLGKEGTKLLNKRLYRVDSLGIIGSRSANESEGVSPAFNLKKESILFSSLVAGTDNEYKLTVIDRAMQTPSDIRGHVDGDTEEISFKFPHTEDDDEVSFSVILLKKRYEEGLTISNASDFAYIPVDVASSMQSGNGKDINNYVTGTFNLPENYNDFKFAYLVYEKIGGDTETDYASTPKYFEFKADEHTHSWEAEYLGAGDDNATIKCLDCSESYTISITSVNRDYGEALKVDIQKPENLPEEIEVSDVIYRDREGNELNETDIHEIGEYTAAAVIKYKDEDGKEQQKEIANNFKITKKELLPTMVTLSEDSYIYDGEEKTPEVTVKNGDIVLDKDDYTVEYKDNVDPGIADVIVTAVNPNYFGKTVKTFRIKKSSVSDKEKEISDKIDDKLHNDDDKSSDDKKNDKDDAEKKAEDIAEKTGVSDILDRIEEKYKKEDNTSVEVSSGNSTVTENAGQPVVVVNTAYRHNIGDKVICQGNTYEVTSNDDADLTVKFIKARSEAAGNITIPLSIVIDGNEYRVTEITDNAFYGNKSLKTAIIGENVEKIGQNAFYGCKKLKNVKIKTPFLSKKTVGMNAFKKINKKAKVQVPKSKLKAYKKILKASGVSGKSQKVTNK